MMRRAFTSSAMPAAASRVGAMSFATTSALYGKVMPFKLADIGEGILKVVVTEWVVKVGDAVEPFDPLCEVESDKASTSIPSPYKGIVTKLYMPKGGEAYVGKPIVDIEVEGDGGANDAAPAASPAATPPAVARGASSSSTTVCPIAAAAAAENTTNRLSGAKALATPAVRRMCMEEKVNLRDVPPTGKGNRVTKGDIIAFISGGRNAVAAGGPASAPAGTSNLSGSPPSAVVGDRVVELTSGVRKAMVSSMTLANEIPSFGASDEVEISKLMEVRESLKKTVEKRGEKMGHGKVKLSFMPFFLKAASLALTQYPEINAHTNSDCTQLIVKGSHNIGFAFDTPKGLIVPNIKDCQNKSIYDIAAEMTALIERGNKGQLGVNDMRDGTFALSNIGSIGATYTKPVINPPSVAIGAIGRAQRIPRFNSKDEVYAANIINISWSADHRVVDGATMVRFSNLWKAYLENPASMLIDTR